MTFSNGSEAVVGLPDVKFSDVQTVKFEFERGEFIVGNVTICDTSNA